MYSFESMGYSFNRPLISAVPRILIDAYQGNIGYKFSPTRIAFETAQSLFLFLQPLEKAPFYDPIQEEYSGRDIFFFGETTSITSTILINKRKVILNNMIKKYYTQDGNALVEFAIVLPLLLLLVFGIIEFGLIIYNKQVITNASREGARYGIVQQNPRYTEQQITTEVNNYCANYLVSFGSNNKQPPTTTVTNITTNGTQCSNFEDNLKVSVTYEYHFLVFENIVKLFYGSMNPSITLSAYTMMKCE